MAIIKTSDGTDLFYKDWGRKDADPVMFHHGWPLSADEWDNQMLFFLAHDYRVIAHDRRGHGRSDQTDLGADMDTYAADVATIIEALNLRDVIHIGHSAGGGEVVRYAARAKPGRIAKAVLIGALPPVMVKSDRSSGGISMEIFDEFRDALARNRAEFYKALSSGPLYGFNREGAEVSHALIDNWWRQGMAGGAKAHYDCIKAFSETDFTDDLEAISVPVLFLHGEDDQIVPIGNSAQKAVRLVRDGTLKTYPGLSHGLFAMHPEIVNPDLLAFAQTSRVDLAW